MSVPTYDQLIEPLLRYLTARQAGATASDTHEAAASALYLRKEQRQASQLVVALQTLISECSDLSAYTSCPDTDWRRPKELLFAAANLREEEPTCLKNTPSCHGRTKGNLT